MLELLLADARTPTGGHAHSGGLEVALRHGLRREDIPAFIRARLRTVARVDAAFAAAACQAEAIEQLHALDLEWVARTVAEPLRRAGRMLGRGLLRTAQVWFPDAALLGDYAAESTLTPRPVVLGVVARAGGVAASEAARLSLYDDAAAVAAAAVKLLPLDAAVATGWLVALRGEIDALSARTEASISTATPLLERHAVDHANTERRLFVT